MGSMSSQKDRESLIKSTSLRAIRETKEPVKITWSNLSYNVTIPVAGTKQTQTKTILNKCTGYALPG